LFGSTLPDILTDIAPMETNKEFRKRLGELFRSQKLAALSTHNDGQPYASLVAFYAADDLKHIYFVTPKTTRKFANLIADSRVAVMVNSSTNQASDFHRAISVTAIGKAEEIEGSEKAPIVNRYLVKHPHLEEFVRSPTCALVRISVKTYYLVKNFQNVMELHL
jgi:general stress protein 26